VIAHKTIVSTQGQRYLNWIETHFNIQRRLYDSQWSCASSPSDLEQRHQAFMHLYNTTAHQGLLADKRLPPIPGEALGPAQGRHYPQEVLAEKFAHALFPRTTNRYGCVTLHSYHFYVESGVPQTQVLLWVYDEHVRAVLDNVVLAEYHCRYDGRARQVCPLVLLPPLSLSRFYSPKRTPWGWGKRPPRLLGRVPGRCG
jgi:hypothetical protein